MSVKTRIKHFFSSYTGRMLVGMLVIHTILVPLVFVGVLFLLQQDYESQFVNNARSESYLLASLIGENPDPARIQAIINDQLLGGQLVLADFKSIDDPVQDDISEDFFFGAGGDKIYHLIVPVMGADDQPIGKLRVGFDETPVMEHIKQTYDWGGLLGVGFIAVSMLFAFFFGHRLTHSVRQLRDAARRIANGNINEQLSLSTNINEVRDMAVAMEYMRSNLVAREREIALHAARQSAVLDTADEGILTLDEECFIQSVNPAAENIFGYREKELIGTSFSKLLIPDDIKRFISSEGQPATLSHQELSGLRKSGETFFLLLSINEANVNKTRFYTVMARDNSERHIFESELEFLATHDILTGLPNRTLLYDRLQQAITQCARAKKLAAVLFIDLDRFKVINDTRGHAAGDIVLKSVAERLRACLREGDSVARNGGDEFTAVLPMLNDPGDAVIVAQKVLATLAQPFIVNEENFLIGCSIGISLYPDNSSDVGNLLKNADAAMYQAKSTGGNTYQFYSA
jgi:diguanylate cyclase (GGDEF)-like protein/PAS domain S-box-containing protein